MARWKRALCALLLLGFGLHIALTSLYVLPFRVAPRDAVYAHTLFAQGWPLFSSLYPLKANIGVSVACLNVLTTIPKTQLRYTDITTPLWDIKNHSPIAPEAFAASRVRTTMLLAYFRYAEDQAHEKVAVSYKAFFEWFKLQPDFDTKLHPYVALANRYCNTDNISYTHASLRGWACPLSLWQKSGEVSACVVKDLGVFALPGTVKASIGRPL